MPSKPAPKGRIKGRVGGDDFHEAVAELVTERQKLLAPLMDPARLMDDRGLGYVSCTAKSKQSGERCKRRPIPGGTVCVMHGGKIPIVQELALERLHAMQTLATDTLYDLMCMRREFPSTGYAAARDVLDRTIGKPTEVVRQEHSGTITIVHELDKD